LDYWFLMSENNTTGSGSNEENADHDQNLPFGQPAQVIQQTVGNLIVSGSAAAVSSSSASSSSNVVNPAGEVNGVRSDNNFNNLSNNDGNDPLDFGGTTSNDKNGNNSGGWSNPAGVGIEDSWNRRFVHVDSVFRGNEDDYDNDDMPNGLDGFSHPMEQNNWLSQANNQFYQQYRNQAMSSSRGVGWGQERFHTASSYGSDYSNTGIGLAGMTGFNQVTSLEGDPYPNSGILDPS
jgi:hypothetical protein